MLQTSRPDAVNPFHARDEAGANAPRTNAAAARPAQKAGPVSAEAPEWLTRAEWNVAYFLGLEAFHQDRVPCGVCEQVAVGIGRLLDAGYRFETLRLSPTGRLEPDPASPRSKEHEESCAQIASGFFDDMGRARLALRWLRAHAPEIPRSWLEELVALYNRVHGLVNE